jgi:hemerythrin-like metal-binding protein
MAMEWNEKYSVNVSSIDYEHKKLFQMINELSDAMRSGKGSGIAPEILKRLAAYTQEHFAHEEKMMVRAGYAHYATHKVEHDKLTKQVVELMRDFDDKKVVLSVSLLDFLQRWLTTHILSCDKQYVAPMQAAGVR